ETLDMTQSEVNEPKQWAIGQTQGALADGVVVFIGLGTIGDYVQEPLDQLIDAWTQETTSIRIIDPELRESWKSALGEDAACQAHTAIGADEFLDALLRA